MGKFADLLAAAAKPRVEFLNEVWADQFPLLADAFFPAPGKATGTYVSPKFSVTAFSDGLALKIVLGAKGHRQKFWMTLSSPEALLEQLEMCLASHPEYWRDAED